MMKIISFSLVIMMIILPLAVVIGCQQQVETPSVPTPTLTPAPTEPAPAPQPETTPEPTPSPPTPAPIPGIGVAVVGDSWQVTVENAHEETRLTTRTSEYTPKPGYTFLVVDATFQNLDPAKATRVSSAEAAVITKGEETIIAAGGGSQGEDCYLGYEHIAISVEDPLSLSLVFIVKKDTIDQVFKLRFQEAPPIPFSVGDQS